MSSIWAIAVNTIRQALRMRIAVVFTAMLVVLLPLMGFIMTGDGTLVGRLQSFISYGLSLTSFLLCLLTIVVTIHSLTDDIKYRQIYTVITKPVRRFQLLLGKLLGVLLLDVALLIFFSGIIYVITLYMPAFADADEPELSRMNNEFFTARAALVPAVEDVTKEVEKRYEKLKQQGALEEDMPRDKIIAKLTENERTWRRAVVPGRQLIWGFHGVKPVDSRQSLFIRFKYDVSVNPSDMQVFGKWMVGDDRCFPEPAPIYKVERRDIIRTFHEIEVPSSVLAEDGYLGVGFFNAPQLNDTIVFFPLKDGLEVLYKADSFTANFLRSVLLIFFHLVFLACLAVLMSTFLSFPVAVLVCLVIFFIGTVSGFCLDSFDYLSDNLSDLYRYSVRPFIQLLPRFDKFNASKFLVAGRLLSWTFVAEAFGLMVCVKSLLLLLAGLLIFSYREIAKVII